MKLKWVIIKNGITKTMRHNILAIIIDQNVMKRTDVIYYLNMFITNHSKIMNHEDACDRWREDIDYISKYNEGKYKKNHLQEYLELFVIVEDEVV